MNKINVSSAADSLVRFAESLDCGVDTHRAQTGSRYIEIDHVRLAAPAVIRVSDHTDAYATSHYTCDGFEGSLGGAKRYILEILGTTEDARRRLARARKAVARRDLAARRQAWAANYAAHNNITIDAAIAACPVRR